MPLGTESFWKKVHTFSIGASSVAGVGGDKVQLIKHLAVIAGAQVFNRSCIVFLENVLHGFLPQKGGNFSGGVLQIYDPVLLAHHFRFTIQFSKSVEVVALSAGKLFCVHPNYFVCHRSQDVADDDQL